MDIGGATRVFALLGNPVSHSVSPRMQNAAFRALGLDAVFVPLCCDAGDLEPLMLCLARSGGGGNVTIPHKLAAAEVLARHDSDRSALPVCNTFWGRGGRLEGAETDSIGILAALDRLSPPPGPWYVIGTGGSALAAIRAAKQAGMAVAVKSRSEVRAAEFATLARAEGVPIADPEACVVVINCTPLGLQQRECLPVEPAEVPAAAVGLDLVYGRGETPWVRAMRAAGCRAADGREVLVEQGAAAFERWFDCAAPREVMRAAVRNALD